MAKKITGYIKLQIPAGEAKPSPPIGPALGQHGVNIMEFCKQFNAQTSKQQGWIIPVIITVFSDRSFSFITKTPPVSDIIKKTLKLESGSSEPRKKIVAEITQAQIRAIAEQKMVDLNTTSIESAMRLVAGTARSMGIKAVA